MKITGKLKRTREKYMNIMIKWHKTGKTTDLITDTKKMKTIDLQCLLLWHLMNEYVASSKLNF